jgi:processive 1,2-diacylglycerol beta-glucosyltransferase
VKVLVLTASTGGGHDMRARAFQAWTRREADLQLEARLHRPLENCHGLYRFGVWLYNSIQRHAPRLHNIYFNYLEAAGMCRSAKRLLGAQRFRATLEETKPDVLLSVHGALNHGFFDCARDVLGRDNLRCVSWCDELQGGYGFSRHWVNPRADLFIGAVPETCEAAVRLGMPAERTRLGGFLVRPDFYGPPLTVETRRDLVRDQLGFDLDQFILLLCASSRGAHNHVRFLEALRQAGVPAQVIVLPGKTAEARQSVENWMRAHPEQPVRLEPHQSDVSLWMRCASAMVARPGTGTTHEAILSGCPLLLNCLGGVMPQERITVEYCRKHGLGEPIRRPQDLARWVKRWIEEPGELRAIRQRMRQVRPAVLPREILNAVKGGA